MKCRLCCTCLLLLALFGCAVAPEARCASPAMENMVWTAQGKWASSRSVMPWDTVLLRGTAELHDTGQHTIRCHLTEGIRFETVTAVKCGGEDVNASLYTVVAAPLGEDCAFAIHLSSGVGENGDRLEIQYTAFFDDRAADEASCHFYLSISGADGHTAAGESGELFLYSVGIYRGIQLPEAPGKTNPISGACFCLYYDPELQNRVAFTVHARDEYLACGGEECPHTRHTYVLRTPENGTVRLYGLPEGSYYLQETRPPDGMTAAAEVREIIVTEEGRVFSSGMECDNGIVPVVFHPALEVKTTARCTLLDIYKMGSRILATALAVLLATRRYYLY